MKRMSCSEARRLLQSVHDGELLAGQRIAVNAHLDSCDGCAAAMEDLCLVRETFRALAAVRPPWTSAEHESFHASVVGRVNAERRESWSAWFREAFRDAHLVCAGMGAVGATVVCLLIMSSMMRFAALVTPGSNQNPVVVDARMLLPRVIDNGFAAATSTPTADEEGAFTLSAVVTREGRLVNLELHPENGQAAAAGSFEARAVATMLGAMAHARFTPARVAGLPIAVNMVWLVEHTTVHAAIVPLDPLRSGPNVRKRRVDLAITPGRRVAVV